MRLLITPAVLLLCALQANAQEPNEAEKHFRAMEKKLADADTVQITASGSQKLGGKKKIEVPVRGTVLLAKGNKARVDFTSGSVGPGSFVYASVSDGEMLLRKVKIGGIKGENVSRQENPKNANALLTGIISRAGLTHGASYLKLGDNQAPPELDDLLPVSDFAMGKLEKVGKRMAQRIDYKLEKFDAQVWLDSETDLPLKRTIMSPDKIQYFSTETCEIRIDAKIEGKKFVLPK